MKKLHRTVALSIPLAFGLWFVVFRTHWLNFWLILSCSVCILAALGLTSWENYDELLSPRLDKVIWGAIFAAVLYLGFKGAALIAEQTFPFLTNGVDQVYEKAQQGSLPVIAFLLLCLIGPGEEIFWRGTVQKYLSATRGPVIGLAFTALIYGLVHIWTFNPALILTALITGTAWGAIYKESNSLIAVITCHSLWDLFIFVLAPIKIS